MTTQPPRWTDYLPLGDIPRADDLALRSEAAHVLGAAVLALGHLRGLTQAVADDITAGPLKDALDYGPGLRARQPPVLAVEPEDELRYDNALLTSRRWVSRHDHGAACTACQQHWIWTTRGWQPIGRHDQVPDGLARLLAHPKEPQCPSNPPGSRPSPPTSSTPSTRTSGTRSPR